MNEQAEVRSEQQPALGELTVVQCPGFRCAAYRDEKGQWREFLRGNVLPEPVVMVLPSS